MFLKFNHVIYVLQGILEARQLERDHPSTPNKGKEEKPAEIILQQYPTFWNRLYGTMCADGSPRADTAVRLRITSPSVLPGRDAPGPSAMGRGRVALHCPNMQVLLCTGRSPKPPRPRASAINPATAAKIDRCVVLQMSCEGSTLGTWANCNPRATRDIRC